MSRRIAIVGAGISGLVCAHLLEEGHDITVFEANAYAGGHTNTIRVDTPDASHQVDTGFIVLNDRTYPNFRRLLAGVGVETQPSDMSFSVSDGRDFEYNGASPNGLFARRSNLARPSFHRMVRDLLRFNRHAPALIGLNGSGPSLGEFLEDGGYSSLYYCFEPDGERVEKVLAEVTNTPWGERRTYVLDGLNATVEKDFHVSPFLGMDAEYRVRLTTPGQLLRVHMESHRGGRVDFDATLALSRRELSPWPLLRYPFMTLRVVAGIYAHAVRLALRGAPYHPHPKR